ncbi:MAG: hypothetical protein Q8L86_12505 [Vicinamibacterales bacterium]|nr:hypothetical protein [Vicinamibacterales bacterium]
MSLNALSPTYWSKRMGSKRYKTTQFRSFANFEEQDGLSDGLKVDRPYRSNVVIENYVKGTALEGQSLDATSDQLTIDTVKGLLMYVDNVDKIQNKYSAAEAWIAEAMKRLNIGLDARFFYEVFSANDTVDDGDAGGTNGNAWVPSEATVYDLLTAINLKFDTANVPDGERKLAASPQFIRVLKKKLEGKNSTWGDKVGKDGYVDEYDGIKFYKTNNLSASARWTPANNPSNNDTLTINGITFTFVTSIGTTAGNVLIGANTAATIDNLVALINAGGVTSDSGVSNVSLSAANKRTVQEWVAVDGTTYIEVRAMGASYMTVSGSEAADVWSAKIQHMLASADKAIDAVIQKAPSVEMASTVSAGKSGVNILPLTLAGFYTFYQGKNEIFDVQVDSSNY